MYVDIGSIRKTFVLYNIQILHSNKVYIYLRLRTHVKMHFNFECRDCAVRYFLMTISSLSIRNVYTQSYTVKNIYLFMYVF